MTDTKLHRFLMPVLGRRRRRVPDSLRPRGTSRISRLVAQYDADVDDALRRLWPKGRIYYDREFARDRADFLLVVRGRGVMIETKVKSEAWPVPRLDLAAVARPARARRPAARRTAESR
jgi:hypothetical protein